METGTKNALSGREQVFSYRLNINKICSSKYNVSLVRPIITISFTTNYVNHDKRKCTISQKICKSNTALKATSAKERQACGKRKSYLTHSYPECIIIQASILKTEE